MNLFLKVWVLWKN